MYETINSVVKISARRHHRLKVLIFENLLHIGLSVAIKNGLAASNKPCCNTSLMETKLNLSSRFLPSVKKQQSTESLKHACFSQEKT